MYVLIYIPDNKIISECEDKEILFLYRRSLKFPEVLEYVVGERKERYIEKVMDE